VRVISGKAKGIRLRALSSKRTRPILDRVKESLFNILGDFIVDSIVLDLFAGTGSLGIEALSRGAKKCLFVDNDMQAVQVIRENLQHTWFLERAVILKKNVFALSAFLADKGMKFDLMLVAPPYRLIDLDSKDRERIFSFLDECVSRQILNGRGIVVLQHHKKQMVNQGNFTELKVFDERRYGNTQLTFLKANLASNSEMEKS
jgi:16S rRNA (guanine966-N2)-methyltransferase